MRLKSVFVDLSFFAMAFVLSGCGLLGGNPTQGISILAKNCYQDPRVSVPQCLPGTELTITPYVPVWGSEAGDCYGPYTSAPPNCSHPANYATDYTHGSVDGFGYNGNQPLLTPEEGPLVVNNAMAPAFWNLYLIEPWLCGENTDPNYGPIWVGQGYYDTGFYHGDGWTYELESGVMNLPIPNYYSTKTGYVFLCFAGPPLTYFPHPLDLRF